MSMSTLTDLIEIEPKNPDEETPEDIFVSAPGFLFPDDIRNLHGDEGDVIIYKSRQFGSIRLTTANPSGENERKLYSHYLWNAGILMAERICGERLLSTQEREQWSVQSQTVLELGAGVGLVGIAASLAGAREVIISDYPAPEVLANIKHNVVKNVPDVKRQSVVVQGHEWGKVDDGFSAKYKGQFDRVIAADCFWMPWQHQNLVQSMLHFLSLNSDSRVLVVGGFHTGQASIAAFFDTAEHEGLETEEIYQEDATGKRVDWCRSESSGGENVTERKRWLVTARLRRKTVITESDNV